MEGMAGLRIGWAMTGANASTNQSQDTFNVFLWGPPEFCLTTQHLLGWGGWGGV